MKRLFLTVAVMLSMSVATFAEGENMNEANNVSAYSMTTSYESLARALNLTETQAADVADIHEAFCSDLASIAYANEEARKAMLNNAVVKELREMRHVLDTKQYRTYVMLLNTTINNRGLNK